ncbi:hypothetical protein DYI26_00125 [Halomonas litopenaei]|nr:hypothetical protein [Halomonas litopenaei]
MACDPESKQCLSEREPAGFGGGENLYQVLETWGTLSALLLVLLLLVLVLQYRRRWLGRVPQFAAAMVLILGSYLATHVDDGPGLTNVYRTLQLFAGQADWTSTLLARAHGEGPPDRLIHGVRLLGLLATLSLVLALFRNCHGVLLEATARIVHGKGRVVVCGLGELGMQFVESYHRQGQALPLLQRLRHRSGLVVIEQDASNPGIDWCLDRGYLVLVRDVFDSKIHQRACMGRARTILLTLPDDTRNIELAIAIRNGCFTQRPSSNDPNDSRTILMVHVDDIALARRAEDASRLSLQQSVSLRFFNLFESSARQVLAKHGPDIYARVADADRIHIALYGDNPMAEALIIHLLQLSAAMRHGGASLCISRFTREPGDAWPDSLAELPAREELASWVEFRRYPLEDACRVPRAGLTECARFAGTPPTQHFVCIDDDSLSARLALALRGELLSREPLCVNAEIRPWNAPVFVRLKRRQGLARLFDVMTRCQAGTRQGDARRYEIPDGLTPFGMLDEVMKWEALVNERRDNLARTFHEQSYSPMAAAPGNVWKKQTKVGWEELKIFFKRSNRAQADHVPVKLRALHCVASEPSVVLTPDDDGHRQQGRSEAKSMIERAEKDARISSEPVWGLAFEPEHRRLLVAFGSEGEALPSNVMQWDLPHGQKHQANSSLKPCEDWKSDGEQRVEAGTDLRLDRLAESWVSACFGLGVVDKGGRLSSPREGELQVETPDGGQQCIVLEQGARLTALALLVEEGGDWWVAIGRASGAVEIERGPSRPAHLILGSPWQRLLLSRRPQPVDHQDATETALTPWERLSRVEHDRWNLFHYLNGWRGGSPRVDPARVHDNLVSWDDLSDQTRGYDRKGIVQLPMLLAEATGHQQTVCRCIRIGVTGGFRHPRDRLTQDSDVRRRWCERLGKATLDREERRQRRKQSGKTSVVDLKPLLDRAASIAAGMPIRYEIHSALTEGPERELTGYLIDALDADLMLVLPLPFDILYQDFAEDDKQRLESVEEYCAMAARATRHLEMPLRFGNLERLGHRRDKEEQRCPLYQQYQLADAWLLQYCDMVVVADDDRWARLESLSSDLPGKAQWKSPQSILHGGLLHESNLLKMRLLE